MHLFGDGKKNEGFYILKNLQGMVQPGEMVLVLGRPGSGCTTFLKVIANQRFGYDMIDGKVFYGPYETSLGSSSRGKQRIMEQMIFISLLSLSNRLGGLHWM